MIMPLRKQPISAQESECRDHLLHLIVYCELRDELLVCPNCTDFDIMKVTMQHDLISEKFEECETDH